MKDRVILFVPAKLNYIALVENFIDLLLDQVPVKNKQKLAYRLRATVNEALANVIKHTPEPKDRMIPIHFEIDRGLVSIRFPDQGKGFKVSGKYPPYPQHLIGSNQLILKTIDGELWGFVEDEYSLKLWFKEKTVDSKSNQMIQNIRAGGMGLSIIVKFMDEARFVKEERGGNYLEVKKDFEAG